MTQSAASALAKPEPRKDGKHVLVILDRLLGDDEIEYNPKDKKDIERASKRFDAAKRDRKQVGIGIDKDGKAETTKDFDPTKPKTVMVSSIAGG